MFETHPLSPLVIHVPFFLRIRGPAVHIACASIFPFVYRRSHAHTLTYNSYIERFVFVFLNVFFFPHTKK